MAATTTSPPASSSSGSTNTNSTSSRITIPQSVPAGLITITQPPESTIAFFKIAPSQPISFAWNFSYVLSTPASLTVSAICENGNTYPVGPSDGKIPGTATSVVWDAYSWQQNHPNSPLAQATYTLEIFDNRGPGAQRAPGLLTPNNALQFALYTPQSYTPIASGWQCTGCASSAITAHPAFLSVCLTILVMFVSGLAILRSSTR